MGSSHGFVRKIMINIRNICVGYVGIYKFRPNKRVDAYCLQIKIRKSKFNPKATRMCALFVWKGDTLRAIRLFIFRRRWAESVELHKRNPCALKKSKTRPKTTPKRETPGRANRGRKIIRSGQRRFSLPRGIAHSRKVWMGERRNKYKHMWRSKGNL